jgi:hypothetical protein
MLVAYFGFVVIIVIALFIINHYCSPRIYISVGTAHLFCYGKRFIVYRSDSLRQFSIWVGKSVELRNRMINFIGKYSLVRVQYYADLDSLQKFEKPEIGECLIEGSGNGYCVLEFC